MDFLERLRSYLERLERAPDGTPEIRIDIATHRRFFAACRDRWYEQQAPGLPIERLLELEKHIQYLRDSLPDFVEEVADQIMDTLAPAPSPEELATLVNVAICWQLNVDGATTGSSGLNEELGRLSHLAMSRLGGTGTRDGWRSPARYTFEIRGTRRSYARRFLTRCGAIFLELVGVDAVRWLLALESAQSLGPTDEWRVAPELAAQLLKEPEREIDAQELIDRSWHFSLATIRRLAAMRLLRYEGQDLARGVWRWSYAVFDRSRPLLEEIAERRSTPLAVLADTLLRDETTLALNHVRPDSERAFRESAASAVEQQARMVVHEIRNALIPAQVAFSLLFRELSDTPYSVPLQRYQRRVEGGIQRAIAFADETLRVASLGVEPIVTFDVPTAVRDAIAGTSGELNGNVRFMPPGESPPVVGPRARFVLAVTNVLRNAAQAIFGLAGVVEVSIEVHENRLVLRVDDSGPGVPEEQRSAIFEPGVSLRAGGSGQGLALSRRVIEGEMQGSIRCVDSQLGGACIEITIPAKEAKVT